MSRLLEGRLDEVGFQYEKVLWHIFGTPVNFY